MTWGGEANVGISQQPKGYYLPAEAISTCDLSKNRQGQSTNVISISYIAHNFPVVSYVLFK